MKKLLLIGLGVFMAFMTGCGSKTKGYELPPKAEGQGYLVSNLVDEGSREAVRGILAENGVNSSSIDVFLNNVGEYNEAINNTSLISEGFKAYNEPPIYENDKIYELWTEKNPVFIGYNCRITAFSLIKDKISIDNTGMGDSKDLFMDEMALADSGKEVFDENSLNMFKAFFSTVQTDMTTDKDTHINNWLSYWKEIGVKFNDDGVSIISVVLHSAIADDENELFIGHTGILAPTNDGRYLFIEKLTFDLPYQAIIFNTKEEVSTYLMNTYDYSYGQNISKPIILENDKVIM